MREDRTEREVRDRFDWQDNQGSLVPEPFGVGLVSVMQPRIFGGDLLKVQDPSKSGAWVVADLDSLIEVRP